MSPPQFQSQFIYQINAHTILGDRRGEETMAKTPSIHPSMDHTCAHSREHRTECELALKQRVRERKRKKEEGHRSPKVTHKRNRIYYPKWQWKLTDSTPILQPPCVRLFLGHLVWNPFNWPVNFSLSLSLSLSIFFLTHLLIFSSFSFFSFLYLSISVFLLSFSHPV